MFRFYGFKKLPYLINAHLLQQDWLWRLTVLIFISVSSVCDTQYLVLITLILSQNDTKVIIHDCIRIFPSYRPYQVLSIWRSLKFCVSYQRTFSRYKLSCFSKSHNCYWTSSIIRQKDWVLKSKATHYISTPLEEMIKGLQWEI